MNDETTPMEIDPLRDPANGRPLLKLWTDVKNGEDLLVAFSSKAGFRKAYRLLRSLRSGRPCVGNLSEEESLISIINAPSGTTFIFEQ